MDHIFYIIIAIYSNCKALQSKLLCTGRFAKLNKKVFDNLALSEGIYLQYIITSLSFTFYILKQSNHQTQNNRYFL